MLRLFATPKTRPTFPAKTCCVIRKSKQVTRLQRFCASQIVGLTVSVCSATAPSATHGIGERSACPTAVERDGSPVMTNRFSYLCVLLFSICAVPSLPAQEETQPGHLPATAASPTATVSLSSSPTPTVSPTPSQLTDVLFKNLKARSIGPAVMGGRVSDIAIDPHNSFVFYVGLGHGGVFITRATSTAFALLCEHAPMPWRS